MGKQNTKKKMWGKCKHTKKSLLPGRKNRVKHLTLNGPRNPLVYLDKCYGKNWTEFGIQSYDHKTETIMKPRKISIKKKNYRKPYEN